MSDDRQINEGTLFAIRAKIARALKETDEAIALLRNEHGRMRTAQEIIAEVAADHQVTPADILGRGQHRQVVIPRHAAMKAVRDELKWSLPRIGRAFGGRHHTSVLSGIEQAEAREARR